MYNVGVIGLGSIAAGYSGPGDARPYVHVGGIRQGERVRLAAVADLSDVARDRFRKKWGAAFPDDLHYYDSDEAMLAAEDLDIVAVCVRGPYHLSVTMRVIEAGPRAIFLEKPPTCSLEELDVMMEAAAAKGIPITASYSRHWDPQTLRLQQLVQEGLIGDVTRVVAYNGASFLSFASHTTDLICQFAGYCPKAVYARGHVREGEEVPEGYEPEPHLDAMVIEFENGVTGVQVGGDGEYRQFYAEVFGTEGYVRAGIYIEPVVRDAEGKMVDLDTLNLPEKASVFKVAYEQIAEHLDGGPRPDCTDEDLVTVHELGFAGIESALTDRRVTLPNANRTRRVWANG